MLGVGDPCPVSTTACLPSLSGRCRARAQPERCHPAFRGKAALPGLFVCPTFLPYNPSRGWRWLVLKSR
ncbi:hypothetical protein Nmel_017695, partial [Mimus melanotis]